jgi:hypothetical protein
MSCILNDGWDLGCFSVGGVEKVYLGTYNSNASYSYDADEVITGATSASTVYLFSQEIEHAGLEQVGVYNRDNGSTAYESKLSLKFINFDKNLRKTVIALGRAPIFAIAKLNNGEYVALGVSVPGRASEGAINAGVKFEDMNGSNISISFKSKDGMFLIDPTLIGTSITVG